jgi:hypothetical protein
MVKQWIFLETRAPDLHLLTPDAYYFYYLRLPFHLLLSILTVFSNKHCIHIVGSTLMRGERVENRAPCQFIGNNTSLSSNFNGLCGQFQIPTFLCMILHFRTIQFNINYRKWWAWIVKIEWMLTLWCVVDMRSEPSFRQDPGWSQS